MTPALLPCPFCGGEAVYEEIPGSVDDHRWGVGCGTENCIGFQWMKTYIRKVDAAQEWNRRVPPEASGRQGDYSAWLIEGDMLPAGQSYAGSAGGRMVWRFDASVAIHFSRKQDAEAMLDTPWFRRSKMKCKVADHLWPSPSPPPAQPHEPRATHDVKCARFPDPYDEREPTGKCTCGRQPPTKGESRG